MSTTEVRETIAGLVAEASDGQITAEEALAEPESLGLLGLTSMGYVRLIQAVERRYGIALEPDDLPALETVPALASYVGGRSV